MPARQATGQGWLDQHQHERRGDEDGNDRLERRRRQGEQQQGARYPSSEGRQPEPHRPPSLACQLPPVAEGAGDRAGHEPDRVRDVGRDRAVAERE